MRVRLLKFAVVSTLTVLTITSFALPAQAYDTDAGRNGCKDYVFMGVRGSGQTKDDSNGLGAQVWATYVKFEDQSLASETVDMMAINYDAVDAMKAINDREVYKASVNDGVDKVVEKVREVVNQCGVGTKIALVGYSQGGQVAHASPEALEALNDDAFGNRVKAVLTIADPTRLDGQWGTLDYTAEDLYNVEEDRGDKGAGVLVRVYGAQGSCNIWAPCIPRTFTNDGLWKVISLGYDADRIVNANTTAIGLLGDAIRTAFNSYWHGAYKNSGPASYQAGQVWRLLT